MSNAAKTEKFIFTALIAALVVPIWYFGYFPTADGASHAENAMNIRRLLTGECPLVSSFFQLAEGIIPNWSGHFIIAALSFVMPALIAEKLVVTLYVILFAYAIWSFIKTYNRDSLYLAFPLLLLTYNHILFGGNYNSLISIALFIILIQRWGFNPQQLNAKNFILLTLSFIFLYFAHFVGFAAFCLSLGVIYIYRLALEKDFTRFLKRSVFCLGAALPSFAMFATYIILPKMPIAGVMPFAEKLTNIFIPSVVYFGGIDLYITFAVTILYWLIFINAIFERRKSKLSLDYNDWPLFISLAFGLAIILAPTSFGGGWIIEKRLQIIFWVFAIFWSARMSPSRNFKYFIIIISLALFGVNYANKLNHMEKYSFASGLYKEVIDQIPENSSILSIDLHPFLDYKTNTILNFQNANLGGFIGAQKCVVETGNFHASERNTIPILYKETTNPSLVLGKFRTIDSINYVPPEINIAAYEKQTGLKIDYIIIRGNAQNLFPYPPEYGLDQHKLYAEFMEQVNQHYKLSYTSPTGLLTLYKHN